jgi:Transposase zinc-ribbon domain
VRVKIERCECVRDLDPGREKCPQPVEHQPLDIARWDAHPFLRWSAIASQKRRRDVVAVALRFLCGMVSGDGWFASEVKCREYIRRLRWPKGFVCSGCGVIGEPWEMSHSSITSNARFSCDDVRHCSKAASFAAISSTPYAGDIVSIMPCHCYSSFQARENEESSKDPARSCPAACRIS